MTGQAFDAKNKLDYDRNTELLAQGLMQIASDPNLKPTMAELSRITGIHRNTIRQRDFPAQRLEAIKTTAALQCSLRGSRLRKAGSQDDSDATP
ncbi:hypothetical protein HXV84_08545 [Pseudomonas amygdali pv. morsprunorum]|nr:hypothetical protein [Pseudomonas amygdali pv. morsprunorum]